MAYHRGHVTETLQRGLIIVVRPFKLLQVCRAKKIKKTKVGASVFNRGSHG